MADPVEHSAAPTRSAEVLFGFCVFLVATIYLLNASLVARRAAVDNYYERKALYTDALERYRSFRAKDAELFQNLAIASIDIAYHTPEYEKNYPTLIRSVSSGRHSRRFQRLPEKRTWQIRKLSSVFGVKAALAFAANHQPADRLKALESIVSEEYKPDPEVARFLRSEVVPRLAVLDTTAEWDRVAWWIAFSTWPQPPGLHTEAPPQVTFRERVRPQPSDFSQRFYIYKLLLYVPNEASRDRELFELWRLSQIEPANAVFESPQVSIPMVGLSVSTEVLVATSAPVVLLLQLMFLVHWEYRGSVHVGQRQRQIAFPCYASPNDPLAEPWPRTITQVVQRCVWALFLVLPTIIFVTGVLTRYDLLYPIGYFGGDERTTLFAAELWSRSDDLLSDVFDWVTFGCMAMSVLVVAIVTMPSREALGVSSGWREARVIWLAIFAGAGGCILTTALAFDYYVAPLSNAADVQVNMHYLAAFGAFWVTILGLSILRSARFLAILSLGGLAIFIAHFIPA